jgi:hypothetical protein
MPPEQKDPRDPQIEALRRYVAQLGKPRERQAAEAPEVEEVEEVEVGGQPRPPAPRRQATVPWLLLTALLVAVALVGGILIGAAWRGGDGQAAEGPGAGGATTTTLGGPVSTPECKTAVDRANKTLAVAVKVQRDLRDYTAIMNELETGKISSAEAVRRGTPFEVIASVDSAKFDRSLVDYEQIVDKCRSRVP